MRSRFRFILSILMLGLLGPCGHGQGNAQTPKKIQIPASQNPALKQGSNSVRHR